MQHVKRTLSFSSRQRMPNEFKWMGDGISEICDWGDQPSTGGLRSKLLRQQDSGLYVLLWASLMTHRICSWPRALISLIRRQTKKSLCYYLYESCSYDAFLNYKQSIKRHLNVIYMLASFYQASQTIINLKFSAGRRCAFWPMSGDTHERTQWLRRIWIRGSVWLVTERCSAGNPVVRLANGIRTLCVRETEPGDDWEALHSRLYLTFSLNLASSLRHSPQQWVCFSPQEVKYGLWPFWTAGVADLPGEDILCWYLNILKW